MQEKVIPKTGPTIFQQIVVPLMAVSFIVITLLQMSNYFFEKHLTTEELKARFLNSLTAAVAYFDATYTLPVQHDLKFIENSYAFNYFLSSQENETLLTKPLAEQSFLHFTNRDKGIYLSLRFFDTAGVEKIITEGSKRKKNYASLLDYPQDMLHNGISDLFSRLVVEKNGTILCGSPFQYQGRWTFLAGSVKGDPETGGIAGIVIAHCDLTEYFTYLKSYEFFGERAAMALSLSHVPMFPSTYNDAAAHFGQEPKDKGKDRDFYSLSKEIRMGSGNQALFYVVFRASPKIFYEETKNVLFRTLLFLFLAILFIGIIIQIISKNFSRPLIALIQAVQRFARGDLSARAHVKTTGEIQMLGEAFNEMAEDLDKTTVSRDSLIKEIEERKIAEEQVKRIRLQQEAILDNIPHSAWLKDREGRYVAVNKAFKEKWGWKTGDVIGKTDLDIWPREIAEKKYKMDLKVAAQGHEERLEESGVAKDGSEIYLEVSKAPVFGGEGQVLGTTGLSQDITERKKAEKALYKAHEELETRVVERTVELAESQVYIQKILATITDYIYTVTVRGGVAVATNHQPTCLAVTGYTTEEFKDRSDLWENMVHEEDRSMVRAFFVAVLAGKNTPQLEHRIRRKDGEIRWVRNTPVLHYDSSGRLTSYDGIIRDITERKRAEILLRESTEKVVRANKTKDQFLANMSHEVRTPLNAILGFTELLKNTSLDPVQKGYVEMLHDGGEILLSLVTDVLDFSKMAAGEVHLEKISFDLESLIRNVIKVHTAKLQEKGLKIFCIVDEKMPPGFRGDPTRIRQVLMNLLSNAIKFTEKGEIEIRVALDREMGKRDPKSEVVVRIAVRDTGIGIPQEKLKTIFDAFVQADISTTRKYGGSGLGLSISKTLADLMGGKVEVQSEPAKGSTFSLVLPLEVGPAMTEIQIFPLKNDELEGKKVLILDDDEMTRDIFTHYCEEAKMVVLCSVTSAQDALKWLSEQSSLPDIFLADILLPDSNGYEVAGKLRENKKYENIKLIAVSGDMREGVASKARQSGFDAYLSKPTSREDLMNVIKTVLGDKREKRIPVEIVTQYTAEELASKGLKVLVVEDNPASQELFSIILKSFELCVDLAFDGREAIEKVKKDSYDLILMDLQMPVMGGVEATRIIREQLHGTMPILALTAGISEDDREKCLAAGMNDYLMKPIEIPKLKSMIFHWIKGGSQGGPVSRKEKSVASVMKWDKQKAIKELGVPEGLYRELVLGFIEQSATAIQNLEKAFRDKDFGEVAKAAHFIKGAAGNLRIEEIHVTTKEMEAAAKGDQNADTIEKQIGSLKNAMEELKKNI